MLQTIHFVSSIILDAPSGAQVSLQHNETSIVDGLKRLYIQKLRPLEVEYHFDDFVSPLLVSEMIMVQVQLYYWLDFKVELLIRKIMVSGRWMVILMLNRWSCFWDIILLEKLLF